MIRADFIKEKQDLTYLQWDKVSGSSGIGGSFLKAYEILDGKKIYYKLSAYDPITGISGKECFNELIVSRFLDVLLKEVLPLSDQLLLLEFIDERLSFVDLKPLIQTDRRLSFLKSHPERTGEVKLIPGGYGISLNGTAFLMIEELDKHLSDYRLTADDLQKYYDATLLATGEVCKRLHCSRQYINSLINKGKLPVFRKLDNVQLFSRSDVEKLLW